MKHKTIFFVMLFGALWLMTACKDDDSTLNVAVADILFDPMGGTQTITIESNDDWSINGLSEWLTVSQYSGINTKEVTLTATANTTGVDREQLLMIRTNDSRNMHTISVRQYAYADGPRFSINDSSVRYFSGYAAGFENTIEINSSAKWKIIGPEWIYMRFKGVETPMSGDLREGSGVIELRANQSNMEDQKRQDTICIQKFGGDEKIIIPVVQLGKNDIMCDNMYLMSDGLWTSFKYGRNNIQYIQCGVEEGIVTIEQVADKGWSYTSASSVSIISDLKPDTDYTICMRGMPNTTQRFKSVSVEVIHTPSEINQPRAFIQDIYQREDGRWAFSNILNQYAIGYYTKEVKSIDRRKFSYVYDFYKDIVNGCDDYYTENMDWNIGDRDWTLLTWAVGMDGSLSNYVDMYQISASSTTLAPIWQQKSQLKHVGTFDTTNAGININKLPEIKKRNKKKL